MGPSAYNRMMSKTEGLQSQCLWFGFSSALAACTAKPPLRLRYLNNRGLASYHLEESATELDVAVIKLSLRSLRHLRKL